MTTNERQAPNTIIQPENREDHFEPHLEKMEDILTEICLHEQSLIDEIEALCKTFNKSLFSLHRYHSINKDEKPYARCHLRVEQKRKNDIHRYLYWCKMEQLRGPFAYGNDRKPRSRIHKLRRPESESRKQGKIRTFLPRVQEYIKAYDPVFSVLDQALSDSARSVTFKQRLLQAINDRIRPTHKAAEKEFSSEIISRE